MFNVKSDSNNNNAFYLWAPFKALKDTLQSIIKNKQQRRSHSNTRLTKNKDLKTRLKNNNQFRKIIKIVNMPV